MSYIAPYLILYIFIMSLGSKREKIVFGYGVVSGILLLWYLNLKVERNRKERELAKVAKEKK